MEASENGEAIPGGPRLRGKRAVVTGAASGIGRATALRFAAEGAKVAVWDVNRAGAEAVASEIQDFGGTAMACTVDISRSEAILNAAAETLGRLHGVEILVNNAGIHDGYVGILDAEEDYWDKVFNINLKSMWLVSRALLPTMLKDRRGAIVNVASISSFTANGGGTIYTAAKHGVVGLTRRMSYELAAQGVRVNAIAPGAVETGITAGLEDDLESPVMRRIREAPAGRMASAFEIANVALFLAGDEASFVHGTVYTADGGWLIR